MAFLIDPKDADSGLSPDAAARKRKLAQALIERGTDTKPIQHWTQGLARLADALTGTLEERRADTAEKEGRKSAMAPLLAYLQGGTAPAVTASEPAAQTPPPEGYNSQGREPSFIRAEGAQPSNDLSGLFEKASAQYGLPADYLPKTAQIESGNNPRAQNPKSSAGGLFQFIDGTAQQYGLTNKMDPVASTEAAARLASDNAKVLRQTLGREPTSGELYLAHQQGAGAAAKLLANPNAPVGAILGEKAVVLNGGSPNMTAGQFASKWVSKFGGQPQAPQAAPPADIPAPGATAAQGFAIPPGSAPGGSSRVNPALVQALTNPWLGEGGKTIATTLLQKELSPKSLQTVDLGNAIGVLDANGNITRQIPKGQAPGTEAKPSYGIIGQDQFGNSQYGWIDPTTRQVTPGTPPAGAQQAPQGESAIPPAPPGVDPKIWRQEQSKRVVEQGMPAKPDDVAGLRKEVRSLPSYKNFSEALPIWRNMVKTAGTSTKASDLNLVYSLGKIFDPGSVVREGEMVMVKNTASLPDWLQGAIASLNGGAALTPETRDAIMAEAQNRISSYNELFQQDAQQFAGIAQRGRMKMEDVIPNFGEIEPYTPRGKKAQPSPSKDGWTEIDGVKIRRKQ